jgi:hypothetical protein
MSAAIVPQGQKAPETAGREPTTTRPRTVLLTGGRAPVTLEYARLFSLAGHRVLVADCIAVHPCDGSQHVAASFRIPSPNEDIAAFRDALVRIVTDHDVALLLPTCEEIFHVARVRDAFPASCRVFVEPIERLEPLHRKDSFVQLAEATGVRMPRTRVATTREELARAVESREPLVLKPVYSRFASRTLIRPTDPSCVASLSVSAEEPWVMQEYLGHEQACSFGVAVDGELRAHSCYVTKYSAGQGATVYFRHVAIPAVRDWVSRFVRAQRFTGQIAFDFIRTDAGEYVPIECNPRATSGLHLFEPEDGLDRVFFDHGADVLEPDPRRAAMVGFAMVLYALPKALREARLRDWWTDFRAARDVAFDRVNLRPFFLQFLLFGVLVFRALHRRTSLLQASTFDIEWNGDHAPHAPGVPRERGATP